MITDTKPEFLCPVCDGKMILYRMNYEEQTAQHDFPIWRWYCYRRPCCIGWRKADEAAASEVTPRMETFTTESDMMNMKNLINLRKKILWIHYWEFPRNLGWVTKNCTGDVKPPYPIVIFQKLYIHSWGLVYYHKKGRIVLMKWGKEKFD